MKKSENLNWKDVVEALDGPIAALIQEGIIHPDEMFDGVVAVLCRHYPPTIVMDGLGRTIGIRPL